MQLPSSELLSNPWTSLPRKNQPHPTAQFSSVQFSSGSKPSNTLRTPTFVIQSNSNTSDSVKQSPRCPNAHPPHPSRSHPPLSNPQASQSHNLPSYPPWSRTSHHPCRTDCRACRDASPGMRLRARFVCLGGSIAVASSLCTVPHISNNIAGSYGNRMDE